MIRVTLPLFKPEWIAWPWPDFVSTEPIKNPTVWITDPHHPITNDDLEDSLRLIVTASTGLNHLPLYECEARGIEVKSLLDKRKGLDEITSSSEATFMLLLMTLRNAQKALNEVANGRWQENEELFRGNELAGKDVSIIGLGRIGRNIFKWCNAFGANVKHIYDPPAGVAYTPLEAVFADSDVVVVSCELNDETRDLIQAEHISLMPANAVLINTARGEVISRGAEQTILVRKDIRVGVDVLRDEVSGKHMKSPLLRANHVTVMPHAAGITVESQTKAARIACEIVAEWWSSVYNEE